MTSLRILSLRPINFRNLQFEEIQFSDQLTCIFGNNGNGKTNILEAIFFLARGKSFRKKILFPQLLSLDAETPEIYLLGKWMDKGSSLERNLKMTSEGLDWYENGAISKRKKNLPVLFIGPGDALDFFSTPSSRRAWFDDFLSLYDANYSSLLSRFKKALIFRNKILQGPGSEKEQQLSAIDEAFIELSFLLRQKRLNLLQALIPYVEKNFSQLFEENIQLRIQNEGQGISLSFGPWREFFLQQRKKELERGITLAGAHRDDFLFFLNEQLASTFCSTGQQKMLYFSLFFASASMIEEERQKGPLLLLDDISGELDTTRWSRLSQFLQKISLQTILTTANENFQREVEKSKKTNKFYINTGTISQPTNP